MKNKIKIQIETDPFVQLVCMEYQCKFNLWQNPEARSACCGFKHIVIGYDGICKMREVVNDEETEQA
jgi:hypothetical protein